MKESLKKFSLAHTHWICSYLWIFIGIVFAVGINWLCSRFFDFEIIEMTWFYVIPVGTGYVGFFAGFGYFLGRYLYNLEINRYHIIVGCLIALGALFGVYYLFYLSLGVTELSDFGQKSFTFIDFFKVMFSMDLEFRKGGVISAPWLKVTFYVFQFLGPILGALIAYLSVVGAKKYCKNCKRFTEEKILAIFDAAKLDEYFGILEANKNNGPKLAEFLLGLKMSQHLEVPFGKLEINYCPGCGTSEIYLRVFSNNKEGKLTEVLELFKKITIHEIVGAELVSKKIV